MAERSIWRNGSKRLATKPWGLYAVRPQSCPAGLNWSGGAPTDSPRNTMPCAIQASAPAAAFELALGVPLQEFVKADFVRMVLPDCPQHLVGRGAPLLRPFPPSAGML